MLFWLRDRPHCASVIKENTILVTNGLEGACYLSKSFKRSMDRSIDSIFSVLSMKDHRHTWAFWNRRLQFPLYTEEDTHVISETCGESRINIA